MKKMLILMVILFSTLAFAMRPCDNIIEPNTDCEVITPVITCNTYDLYNTTHNLKVNDGAMTQIGATGVYYFTFNQPDSGTHKILLCDNTTGTIEVASYSNKVIYDNGLSNSSSIRTELATVQTDLDTPNQYKADVSALSTASQLTSNISNLQDYGDTNWATADVSSLATTVQLTQNTSVILSNISKGTGDIISRGNSAWITAVGFSTTAQANAILSGTQDNRTSIENKIDTLANITASDVDTLISDEAILNGLETNKTYLEGNISSIRDDISSLNDVSTTDIDNACISELELNTSHSTGNYSSKADVSSLATASQLTSNLSNIQTYGDTNWLTATGFSTTAQALAILTGIQSNTTYLEGNLSTLPTAVWNVATRTLSTIAFTSFTNWDTLQNYVWNATGRTIINDTSTITDQLTSNMSNLQTYGDSGWATATGFLTDTIMNNSHGGGLYNTSSTASISSGDIATIANETFKKLIQNKTEVYNNDSDGYPDSETWNYIKDGITVIKDYNYYSDNVTIKNSTFTRTP